MADEGDRLRGRVDAILSSATRGEETEGARGKRTKSLNVIVGNSSSLSTNNQQTSLLDHHQQQQQSSINSTRGHQQQTKPTTTTTATTKSIAEMMTTTTTSTSGGATGSTTKLSPQHRNQGNRASSSSSSSSSNHNNTLAHQDPKTSFTPSNQPARTFSSSGAGGRGGLTSAPHNQDPDRKSSDGKYCIDDLPREVIIKALDINYSGPIITSAECGVRGRCEVFLIDGWIILLVDRKSPFVSKNARDFISLVHALRKKHRNPGYRGAVLTRESALHRESKMTPFARSTQQSLLEQGIILLSIPDQQANLPTIATDTTDKNEPFAPSSSSSSSSVDPNLPSVVHQNSAVTAALASSASQRTAANSNQPSDSTITTAATATNESSSGGPTMARTSPQAASPNLKPDSKESIRGIPGVAERRERTQEGASTTSGGEDEDEEDN